MPPAGAAAMPRKPRRGAQSDLGDLRVLAVSSNGEVLFGLPGGRAMAIHLPRELVPFYRRLIPDDEPPAAAE